MVLPLLHLFESKSLALKQHPGMEVETSKEPVTPSPAVQRVIAGRKKNSFLFYLILARLIGAKLALENVYIIKSM